MRISHPLLAVAMAAISGSALSQASASTSTPPATTYDFAYRTTDDRVQVFDDGQQTYLQLPANSPLPVVTTTRPAGEVLLRFAPSGTYLVAPGLYSSVSLRWPNQREVTVRYAGAASLGTRAGAPAAFGAVTPQASFGAVARPQDVAQGAPAHETGPAPRASSADATPTTAAPPRTQAQQVAAQPVPVVAPAPISPVQPAVLASEPVVTATASVAAESQSAQPAVASIEPTPPARLRLRAGDRLRSNVEQWLQQQSVELSWEAAASTPGRIRDVELSEDFESTSADVKSTLTQILPPLGFDAEIVTSPRGRRVVVRNAGNRF